MMRWRSVISATFRIVLVMGLLAMPVAIFLSLEYEGGTPALELQRQKRIAKTVLLAGGGTAMLAAIGLYLVSRHGQAPKSPGDWSA
jgi:hypothetical protein